MNQKHEIINASAYQYQLAIQDQFKAICDPLFKLGIKYFSYGRIFQDGRYLLLINNELYMSKYLELIRDHGKTFTRQMHDIREKQSTYYSLQSDICHFDKKDDPIIHLMYEFNMWNQVYLYKGSGTDFVEFYSFSGDRNDTFLPNFCINNLALLDHFCDYFNEKAKDLIDSKDQRKLTYFEQQFNFYHTPQDVHLTKKVEQFLQETQLQRRMLKTYEGDIPLTRREGQCLHYLTLGKSTKEIARIVDLSPRTIEFYVRNLKQKSGLNRNELLTAFARDPSFSHSSY